MMDDWSLGSGRDICPACKQPIPRDATTHDPRGGAALKCEFCHKRADFIICKHAVCPDHCKVLLSSLCDDHQKKRSEAANTVLAQAEIMKGWRKDNPEAVKGANTLNRAVQQGIIKRPDSCSACGRKTRVHAHHEDYTKPLEVVWLCCSCHRRIHSTRSK
jgi:hypothetical protein